MKKTISISFFCIALVFNTFAQLKKTVIRFPNDSTSIYQQFYTDKANQIQGEYIEYFQNQSPSKKGFYKNNLPEGKWQLYYQNGLLKAEGNFENGKNTGIWTYYFENGNTRMVGKLTDNTKEGNWKFYYENAFLKSEGMYLKGSKNGIWKYYNEEGLFKAEATFENDEGIYIEYYEDGTVKMKGKLKDERSFGIWKYYYPNGNLKAIGKEENGLKDGEWHFYFDTGELKSVGFYEKGKSEGEWKYYYKDGILEAKGKKAIEEKTGYWNMFFPNGKLKIVADYDSDSSNYFEYYESGKLKIQGQFANKNHDGTWNYYYENGTKEGYCEYKAGEGLYKGFYENGQLKMEGTLLNGKKTGNWKMYNQSGNLVGIYKTYSNEEYPTFEQRFNAIEDSIFKDNAAKASEKALAPKTVRKAKSKYPGIQIKEREIIVSTNLLSPFFGSLPISAEYYTPKKMSHQVNFFYLNTPFFTPEKNINYGEVYSNGFSIDYRLKNYQKAKFGGIPYFAQELRFKVINNNIKIQDSVSVALTLSERETNYEYSLMFGTRQFYKKIDKRLTTEFHFGLGVGYKTVQKNWENNPNYDILFDNFHKNSLDLRFRLGGSIGYTF